MKIRSLSCTLAPYQAMARAYGDGRAASRIVEPLPQGTRTRVAEQDGTP